MYSTSNLLGKFNLNFTFVTSHTLREKYERSILLTYLCPDTAMTYWDLILPEIVPQTHYASCAYQCMLQVSCKLHSSL